MSHPPPTIAIKGRYGYTNFGDDALMVAAYKIINRVFSTNPSIILNGGSDYFNRLIPGVDTINADKRNMEKIDVIVLGGGTQFFSFQRSFITGLLDKFRQRIQYLKHPNEFVRKLFQKMDIGPSTAPMMIAIGIGIGPFENDCTKKERVRKLFKRFDYVAVRDGYSADLCKAWDISNTSVYADLCYLKGCWDTIPDNFSTNEKSPYIRKIGVIPRDWPHTKSGNAYAQSLLQTVHRCNASGKEVDYILFGSDKGWTRRLKNVKNKIVTWNPETQSIAGFFKILSTYDAFVTSRFHGAVFASILGKPVVCIEIEQKLKMIADMLGEGARLWSHPFDVETCMNHITSLDKKYDPSVKALKKIVAAQGILVEKMIEEKKLRYGHLIEINK